METQLLVAAFLEGREEGSMGFLSSDLSKHTALKRNTKFNSQLPISAQDSCSWAVGGLHYLNHSSHFRKTTRCKNVQCLQAVT